MTKDKRIDEMARDICHLTVSCEECVMLARKTGQSKKQYCKAMQYAERAYTAGYRKASDVVEEIADFIWEKDIAGTILPINGRYLLKQDFIDELKKRYTEDYDGQTD